jgi:hypothetical protein
MATQKRQNPRGVKQVRSLEETAHELRKARQAEAYHGKQTIAERTPKGTRKITLGGEGEEYGSFGYGRAKARGSKKKD